MSGQRRADVSCQQSPNVMLAVHPCKANVGPTSGQHLTITKPRQNQKSTYINTSNPLTNVTMAQGCLRLVEVSCHLDKIHKKKNQTIEIVKKRNDEAVIMNIYG